MHLLYFLGPASIELGDQLTYITLNREMHSIGRSGPSWIENQPELENPVLWNFTSQCDSVIIHFVSRPIAVQGGTQLPFWGRWQSSHKCHLRMAHGRLTDGSLACPRASNSCHTGEKLWKKRTGLPEKGVLSHGVSRGVHINACMRPARELYAHQCRQLCADLKTNKKIPVMWNIDQIYVVQCMFDYRLMALSIWDLQNCFQMTKMLKNSSTWAFKKYVTSYCPYHLLCENLKVWRTYGPTYLLTGISTRQTDRHPQNRPSTQAWSQMEVQVPS